MINPVSFRYEGIIYPRFGYQNNNAAVLPVDQIKRIAPTTAGTAFSMYSTRKTIDPSLTQIKYNTDHPYDNARMQSDAVLVLGRNVDLLA